MISNVACTFCNKPNLKQEIIRAHELFFSVVSKPWFRPGHCLVIPSRHITTLSKLRKDESAAIMTELGRLASLLDNGFGTGIMQKYQPLQVDNGIKVSHLHFHIFPRLKSERLLFPVPQPNNFDGYFMPNDAEVTTLTLQLK